ncbi:thioredoxin domain-containing protein [Corynebacterium timonense]|uniref:Protein-disulfide isomerase n=1 Tax=Corynebacterium timonense TaxID=441500 RepID=A0A1H1LDM1_9CORY|nr:thioredoxin domain-containing protein [Corynebacterium timonense]SDR72603.1 Protein-disulfide isomerase [Corynebacterium timonense]
MTTRKVTNPNEKKGGGFIWAIVAVVAIAVLVIGLVVYNGRNQRDEAMAERMIPVDGLEVGYTEGDETLVLSGGQNTDAPVVDLFEDFSCPHCADLAKETDEEMLEKIRAGELEVHLRPMTFLDGQGENYQVGHSTRALAAELALAGHNDVAAMWNLRVYLLENQQSAFNSLDADGFADLARDYGASDEAVQDIRDEAFLSTAEEMGKANLDYQNEQTGEAYSPRVMKDGQDLEIPSGDINDWVDAATA